MEQNKRLSSEARKEQIIQSALSVFIEKGFSGTTTAELAKAAGISEVTLFRHFSSKQEIFHAGVEPILFESLTNDMPVIEGKIGVEALSNILFKRIKFLADHRGIIKLILNEHLLNQNDVNVIQKMAVTFGKLLGSYQLAYDESFMIRLFMGSFLSFLYLPVEDEASIKAFATELAEMILGRN
jgi:AcrR family transcriptional regulator